MGLPKRNSPISKSGDQGKIKVLNLENKKKLPLKIMVRDVEWSK